MKYEFYNTLYDFEDDIELYFLHERMLHEKYLKSKNSQNQSNRVDRYTRVFNKDLNYVWSQRAATGSIEWARPTVQSYDEEMFEKVSEDFTMCWKRTDKKHDTLIIHLTSFAGHEGRLTSPLTNISEKIINLDTDLLIVNEDPFRMPEILYPSMMVLGVSSICDTIPKTASQIKKYIEHDYKNIVLYADSKHAGSVLSIAYELVDLNPTVIVTGGQTTYDWDTSPWVKHYLKWFYRPEHLKDQFLDMHDVAIMHFIKSYKFKQFGVDKRFTDPYPMINEYKVPVHFFYGKYDTDYARFKNYVSDIKSDYIKMYEVDYKISKTQTHNIKPYVDRKILPKFINNLS